MPGLCGTGIAADAPAPPELTLLARDPWHPQLPDHQLSVPHSPLQFYGGRALCRDVPERNAQQRTCEVSEHQENLSKRTDLHSVLRREQLSPPLLCQSQRGPQTLLSLSAVRKFGSFGVIVAAAFRRCPSSPADAHTPDITPTPYKKHN
ncbi:unnamed protein product [Pleuronectes platessa]|uniref:Uncharacterized protein n=1 Tax=Pleuronectes platessa TaxID=8262 RepID=A0A9N7VFB1_PLEPL|nr:unnamed protein product [Pleuronectes platessa]